MSAILVINSGSSSLKYQLIDSASEERIASGLIERIGESVSNFKHTLGAEKYESSAAIADHTAAFAAMDQAFAATGAPLKTLNLVAVGHRVVQGGDEFFTPVLIDNYVTEQILNLSSLAPLHNPGQHAGILAAKEVFPTIPHVAVFDTAFHQTMPPSAYTYAIDTAVAQKYQVRRYGFHGTSHQYVSEQAAAFLQRPNSELKQVILHLGNGASACAVDGGKSINTSMGLTPLQGLVMGSRSGDIDPSALIHLHRQGGFDVAALDTLLNKQSGLLGLTGNADMRDVTARAEDGDTAAQLALDVYAGRVRHYLGAYMLELGRLDTIVFTAGVGENASPIRELICKDLKHFGIELDPELNLLPNTGPRRISTANSAVEILVIPTDEELAIARQARSLVS